MIGLGKYDDACTAARVVANAEVAIVLILNGDKGSGFSVQGDVNAKLTVEQIAGFLEQIAAEMRRDAVQLQGQQHEYPSNYPPGKHWAIDAAWEILDTLKPGVLSIEARSLLAGMIAGRLTKERERGTTQ
jgi:hypothetical protein